MKTPMKNLLHKNETFYVGRAVCIVSLRSGRTGTIIDKCPCGCHDDLAYALPKGWVVDNHNGTVDTYDESCLQVALGNVSEESK